MASDEGLRKFADAAGYGADYFPGGLLSIKETVGGKERMIYMKDKASSNVDHPAHYGGADNPYEAIKVVDAWGLGFSLGNAIKYIARAGRKDQLKHVEDLEKARWYLDHEIARLKNEAGA